MDASELFAFPQQDGPNLFEDAVAAPSLEPAMDRAIVAEMLGKLVPLRGYPVTGKHCKLLLWQEVSTSRWQQGCPRCVSPTPPT